MSAYSERRIGRFIIRREAIDDNLMPLVMASIEMPLEMRRDWVTDNTFVTAASLQFDVVAKGETVPMYEWLLTGHYVEDKDITGIQIGGHMVHTGVQWSRMPVCEKCGAPHPSWPIDRIL
jgi:hypothetical protein